MIVARPLFMSALLASAGLLAPAGADVSRAAATLAGDMRAFAAAGTEDTGDTPAETPPAPPLADDGQDYARAADGLFYVHALINGKRIRFVVDTGSSVVVLTAGDAATLGLGPPSGRYGATIRTASGTSSMAWTSLDTVRVGTRTVHDVTAAIVPNGPPVSLMGQNMLSRLGPMTIDGGRLRLS